MTTNNQSTPVDHGSCPFQTSAIPVPVYGDPNDPAKKIIPVNEQRAVSIDVRLIVVPCQGEKCQLWNPAKCKCTLTVAGIAVDSVCDEITHYVRHESDGRAQMVTALERIHLTLNSLMKMRSKPSGNDGDNRQPATQGRNAG